VIDRELDRPSHSRAKQSAYQLMLFETVTGSPTKGVTRVRATALSTHERMAAGGAEEPKCTELGTPEGAYVATT